MLVVGADAPRGPKDATPSASRYVTFIARYKAEKTHSINWVETIKEPSLEAVEHLILITGTTEASHLCGLVRDRHPSIRLTAISSSRDLKIAEAIVTDEPSSTRIITISTSIIVPERLLNKLQCRGYNFHAGPPAFPGSHPASFAIFDGARTFGVTLHELAPAIDSGAIIAVDYFPIPSDITAAELNSESYVALLRLFSTWIDRILETTDDLSQSDEQWIGAPRTHREAVRLANTSDAATDDDRDRRKRAFSLLNRT